ncbi:signal-induced proliferation-associated 1-like protein 2 [Hyperolius riggenbachi]|uniref:signal-induced proliferation-associated 1-like protein 2 n=1 Tax=Hyperolius riggenbachi TaxID=752182 RepID=UPI0035A29D6E
MGVRARVSEWLPKRDFVEERCRTQFNYESFSLSINGRNDQSGLNERPLDTEVSHLNYMNEDLFSYSPESGLQYPIIQRRNSEVGDNDLDDVLDQDIMNPNTGESLHREYGSTSSIDRQGLYGDKLFAMLKGYTMENVEHKNLTQFTFSEVVHYDPFECPSLLSPRKISKGPFASISEFEYLDRSLLPGRKRDKLFKKYVKTRSFEPALIQEPKVVVSEPDVVRLSFDLDSNSGKPWTCVKSFAHYDVQSIFFNLNEAMETQANIKNRKNITTGASTASQSFVGSKFKGFYSHLVGEEHSNTKAIHEHDEDDDGKNNEIIVSCPYFRNEIGGESDRWNAFSKTLTVGENCSFESSLRSHCANAEVSVLEVPREDQSIHRKQLKRHIIEHIDVGAYYYRKFFYGKEHQNYFGIDENLGPVAVSICREKVESVIEKERSSFCYRIIFRTSELTTLRGAVLEDSVPSTARHGSPRGLPHKEILEYIIPELNLQCLRHALSSPKVPDQLLKLDEQELSFQHKVGILYCKSGQSTEEEMYNNETSGPAFEEFLDLLGQRLCLKGLNNYRAQLDHKTDSAGTHSLYTIYKEYELMFHVSTSLPYMAKNKQQVIGDGGAQKPNT